MVGGGSNRASFRRAVASRSLRCGQARRAVTARGIFLVTNFSGAASKCPAVPASGIFRARGDPAGTMKFPHTVTRRSFEVAPGNFPTSRSANIVAGDLFVVMKISSGTMKFSPETTSGLPETTFFLPAPMLFPSQAGEAVETVSKIHGTALPDSVDPSSFRCAVETGTLRKQEQSLSPMATRGMCSRGKESEVFRRIHAGTPRCSRSSGLGRRSRQRS
jgi:hypothetical protein